MPKKIVVVGAVAAGMSAATRARRLDEFATITVFEKGSYASFANCGIPYALGEVIQDDASLILHTPEDLKTRFNIDVHLNNEVVNINSKDHTISVRAMETGDIRLVDYEKLILAQGAEPFRPRIDGADLDHVHNLHTIPDLRAIKVTMSSRNVKHVCIIGAGFIGLEAAENMRNLGLDVSMVDFGPHVLLQIDADMAEILHSELRRKGVALFLNKAVEKIKPSSVVLTDGTELPAELVIMVPGVRPRTALAMTAGLRIAENGVEVNSNMQTSDPDIYAVGDMVETQHRILGQPRMIALAGPANRQGRMAADHLFGRAVQYRGNVGTAICRVFDLSAGFVGLSIDNLHRAGRDPLWVTVHSPNHADYYPGAHPITLKLIFEKTTGRLLGCQAIGLAGVDKRIDVIATAMQAGMTVFDLEHLELAYAPPYGSAKDPVNMAGFVGSNVLRGDTEIIHNNELTAAVLEQLQVVDVRSPKEFAGGHIFCAINLPLGKLRDQVSFLNRSQRVLVYCQVGYRGYLAYRILKQEGFDVKNLDGGFKGVLQAGCSYAINRANA